MSHMDEAVTRLVKEVNEMRGPGWELNYRAGERLRLGMSMLHLEYKEVESEAVRLDVHRRTGEKFREHLGF